MPVGSACVSGSVPLTTSSYILNSRACLKRCQIRSIYSETSLKRPPKGPGNSGRYREVVRRECDTNIPQTQDFIFIDLLFLQFCYLVGIQSFYAQVANRSHMFLQLWL